MKRLLFVLTLLVALLGVTAVSVSATEYFVDVKVGKDTNGGTTDAPFATIQKAADIVQPGDTVIIRPGIYYENVELKTNGTKDAPIVFKAEKFERDSVIISGADRNIAEHKVKWTLEDVNLGLYSIPFDYPIYRMTANDVQVVEYIGLAGLKTYKYAARDDGTVGYVNGYEHGFCYKPATTEGERGKLYIRLGNDECLETDDPNSDKITINVTRTPTSNYSNWNGKTYSGQGQSGITGKDSFLFGVTTESSANVVISGITFKMPAVAAVWARCDDLTVSNCWFIGCIEGVRGGCAATADPTYVSKNIVIEYCFYTNYPIYTDAMKLREKYKNDPVARTIPVDSDGKIITNANGKITMDLTKTLWFWHAKTDSGTTCNYEGGGLACYIGEDWTIRYCHFDDLLDGFSSFGNFSYWTVVRNKDGKESLRQTPARNVTIYGNKFDKILDNAIEMEDNVQGMEIAYNEFTNQISPFSWQPQSGIPYATDINIHHNVVHNTEEESWALSSVRNHIEQDGIIYKIFPPQYFGLFKLGADSSKFGKLVWMIEENYPMDANGTPLDAVIPGNDGIRVWNNTFIFPNGAFEEPVGLIGGGVDRDANIHFKNNIINVAVCAEDGTYKEGYKEGQASSPKGINYTNNMLVSGLNIEGSNDLEDITVDFAARTTYEKEPIDDNGIYKESMDLVGFKDWRNGNFELTADSPARGAGVQIEGTDESTVDLGAIPYGEKWTLTAGPYLEADVNLDGSANFADIVQMAYCINSNEYNDRADINFDGVVDEDDLNEMVKIFARNGGALK